MAGRRRSPSNLSSILMALAVFLPTLSLNYNILYTTAFQPFPIVMSSGNHGTKSTRLYEASLSPEEEAQKLKEEAQRLRQEIEQFQQEKDSMETEERQKIQKELDVKQAYMDRYSAVVPILKPDGSTVEETVQFPPRLDESQNSEILVCEASLPLGIILGESEEVFGMTLVDEVVEGSNADVAGVKVGDVVRGFTATSVEMEQPTWQLIAGGIGRPKTMRFMFGPDGKPFEQVMEAIGSNRMDPDQRPVVIVLERATAKS